MGYRAQGSDWQRLHKTISRKSERKKVKVMEGVLRDISSIITRNNDESIRIYRGTVSLLRCFIFFDVCWLLSGIALIVMALTSNVYPSKEKVIIFGGVIGAYASLSAFVNSLARHGVNTWRRSLLLPWLGFYSLVYCLLLLWTAESLYRESLQWRHLFLFMALFSIFSCWRHMMREMVGASEAQIQAQEPPPKYEELEEQEAPPQYSSCVLEIKEEENSDEANDNNVRNQDPKPENLAVMEQPVRRFV